MKLLLAGALCLPLITNAQLAINDVIAGPEGIQFDLSWGPLETVDQSQYVQVFDLPYRGFSAAAHEVNVNFGKIIEVFFDSSLVGGLGGCQFDLSPSRAFSDAFLEGGPGLTVLSLEELGLQPFRLNSITADPDDPYGARFSFDTLPDNTISDPVAINLPESGGLVIGLLCVFTGGAIIVWELVKRFRK